MKSLATFRPKSPKAMFGPAKPTNQYGWALDNYRQVQLHLAADALLRKAGFFPAKEEIDEIDLLFHPDMISDHGPVPTWHGRP